MSRLGLALYDRIIASLKVMIAILDAFGMFVADLFKSRCRLEAENLFLRNQLNIALRRAWRACLPAAISEVSSPSAVA
jgi:hypothetical protein